MPEGLLRIAVLVSGGGSNLGALLKAQRQDDLGNARVTLVISSRADAYALQRAADHGVESVVLDRKQYLDDNAFEQALLDTLEAAHIHVVALAGYLRKIGPRVIARYRGRILNIHPALLPKFGGAGMYGRHVHEAVLKAGETESGCSVHLVDEEFDHGQVLAQARVPVMPEDTPEELAARVLEQEHQLYPATVADFCNKLMTMQGSSND